MSSPQTLGVIPARFQSSRLPGKALADIAGKSLVQRVWEQASEAKQLSRVVIATDDERIVEAGNSFGAETVMTDSNHPSGSDRIAEVVRTFAAKGEHYDAVANIQGDMPFVEPELIDRVVNLLHDAPHEVGISTVAGPILNEGDFLRPSAVKVVFDENGDALYFSRSAIPYWREKDATTISDENPYGYKHIGLYVYRTDALLRITKLPQSRPEQREQLEQLRALSAGIKIRVLVSPRELIEHSIEVDTPEDLKRAQEQAS